MADQVIEGGINLNLIVFGACLVGRRRLDYFVCLFECCEVVADAVGEVVVAEGLEQSSELNVGDVLVFDEEGVDQSGVEFASSEVARFAIGRSTVLDEFERIVKFGEELVTGA